ncbi:MAG: MauE/DoxX family redox-associated membrane protein [Pseudomonadales bacterium]
MVMVSWGIAVFLAWLFLSAGWHKLRSPSAFSAVLAQYLAAASDRQWLVYPLAISEFLLAVLLLLPATQVAGAMLASAFLALYAGVMTWQLAKGRRDVRCGCAGPASEVTVSPSLIIRNLMCAAAALVLVVPAPWVTMSTAPVGLVAFVGGFLVVLYLCSDQLIANSQKMAGSR